MKSLMKYLAFLIIPSVVIGVLSCKKDDNTASDGEPVVYYIRSTDPGKSDSLIVGSFMGSLIAIVGDNLGNTRELWFNDQQATLNPTYITDKTILVSVPSTVPTVVTNKMRFVFADGTEMLYDFSVNVPEPLLGSIKCEYVPDGGTVVLEGDFFFDPIKVVFPGDLEAQVVSLEKTKLEVTVPAGATSGPISVQTNFGKSISGFRFRDDRNILLDYDTKIHETWTAPIANSGDNPLPSPCDANYAFFKHAADGAWLWTNELTMQYWAPRGRGNIPVATGNIDDLVFKFECNVPEEWRDVRMEIFFGPYAEDHGRDVQGTVFARWKPWKNGPYTTDGWITVSIPMSEFKYYKDDPDDDNGTRKIDNLSSLTNVTMMLFGPADGTNPVYVAIDNVRIVPK
ncbi:MAG: hypothetical protein KDC61_00705 [Saprospiraceae bacterium]|nr:hypothetical protein [Saprospiraceae bacterium]